MLAKSGGGLAQGKSPPAEQRTQSGLSCVDLPFPERRAGRLPGPAGPVRTQESLLSSFLFCPIFPVKSSCSSTCPAGSGFLSVLMCSIMSSQRYRYGYIRYCGVSCPVVIFDLSHVCLLFAFFSVRGPVFSRTLRTCRCCLLAQLVHQARNSKRPVVRRPKRTGLFKKLNHLFRCDFDPLFHYFIQCFIPEKVLAVELLVGSLSHYFMIHYSFFILIFHSGEKGPFEPLWVLNIRQIAGGLVLDKCGSQDVACWRPAGWVGGR